MVTDYANKYYKKYDRQKNVKPNKRTAGQIQDKRRDIAS